MSSSDKKNDDSTVDGLAAAGRAVGRAMGYFRRLAQRDPEKKQKEEEEDGEREKRKARWKKARKRRAPATASKRRRLGGGERLAEQISRIEQEIDRVYGAIVAGASDPGRAGSASDRLSDLIQRSKELKRELGEKRADLARLERDAERERVLKRRASLESETSVGPAESPAREAARTKKAKRGRAARALPRGPSQLQQTLGRITFEDDSVRFVFERVAQNLSDPDPDVRRSAAVKLGELDMPVASRVLAHAVEDPAEKVSIAALNALVRLGSPESIGLFKRHLRSNNQHIRLAALRGLAKVGDGDGSVNPRLIEALEDDQPTIRKTAATLLGWREVTDAVTPLLSTLRDDDDSVRAAAATALGALRVDKAVLSLIRTLLDPALEVRKAAHQSLKAILGEEVTVDLEDDADLVNSSLSEGKRDRQVEALKEWWRTARVDKQIERQAGPPLPEDVMELKPPAEPLPGPPPDVKEPPPAEEAPAEFETLLPEVEEEEKKEEVEEEEKKEEVEEEEFESLLDESFGGEEGGAEAEGAEGEGEYESLLDGDLGGEEAEKESKKKKKKD